MKSKNSDLIAIANAGLAQKLEASAKKIEKKKNADTETNATKGNTQQTPVAFKQDVWRAVFILNLMRYGLAAVLLLFVALLNIKPELVPIKHLLHPGTFIACTVLLLISAIAFSYISVRRLLRFNTLVLTQFSLDLIIVSFLVHSAGGIESAFTLLFIMIVATGSVVLPRIQALGLAGGTIILMLYQHSYNYLRYAMATEVGLLATYSIIMFLLAWAISYLAERLRIAELKTFVPGNESIEEFLVREEIKALESALKQTNGNKTEAAKLIGMTFRSFRYKLTKYDIA